MCRHWNFEPASVDVKRKVAVRERVLAGGRAVMVVFGRVRSTIHVATAAVGSAVAPASTAMTSNVWGPSVSGPDRATADVQGPAPPLSSSHVKVSPPGSFELKANVALVWLVFAGGRWVKKPLGGAPSATEVSASKSWRRPLVSTSRSGLVSTVRSADL